MRIQIKQGVALTVIPVSQFKNTQISVHFLENASKLKTSYRSLLANILETSSKKYVTQILVSRALSQLYGAGFGTTVMWKQNIHDLTFSLSLPNDHYLDSSEDLLSEGIQFLQEMIFNPLAKDDCFHEQTFQRQQANLIAYINALQDDKQSYAALQLQKLVFNEDEVQSVPAFGDAKSLAEIKNHDLFDYYQLVLAHDRVEIYVVGDVNANQVVNEINQWPFVDRSANSVELTNSEKKERSFQARTENQDVVQAKLDLAYQFPTDFRNDNYYAGIVFNALFGGSPLSKLFINVRERASLAYYANSSVDIFNGLMVVQAGINSQDKEQVLTIIAKQLTDMQAGDFTDEQLVQIKKGLISNYVSSLDLERVYASRELTNDLVGSQISAEEWIDQIQKVSRESIMKVAKQVELQAVYFLSSEVKTHA
ncbi:EF-P 5-aminopentanol modification-associated protein YfmF [Pediococcus damnosus]|uniref:Zinc protease n=1 Tax=Pediococcus damnosus TaxID=51663 RepID=A0AAC9FIQ2_9LACO|nr:pitrilysin family protein [Pediococcus damnosus]AMV62427.1 Zinc protease [Pediococcus damnosus]